MGLFKTAYVQSTQITNSNTAHISSTYGSDTNVGSREAPVATITKARTLGKNIYLLSGTFFENASGSLQNYIGDGSCFISGQISGTNRLGDIRNLSIKSFLPGETGYGLYFCVITSISGNPSAIGASNVEYCFIETLSISKHQSGYKNNTVKSYLNCSNSMNYLEDTIVIDSTNLYNFTSRSNTTYYPIFQNCLFRKATLWKWNTVTITINWTNNPVGGAAYTDETLMTRVYNSLLFYANSLGAGTDKTYFLAILATQDTMFKECVVWDDSDTVNNPIFSRYVDGVPVDYTLALKSNNPALYMSTTGSYVGCYAANVNDDGHGNHITFGAVKHVDETTGLDTATSPDLLIQDQSNPAKFSASQTSLQLWNRIRTSVVEYPRGKSFAGMQSQLDSGIASRLFFGKRQEIRTTGDISQKTTAFESVEVIPYDSLPDPNTGAENDITGLSATLPRFSAPFNGECLLFYKGGNLLKFNDYNGLKTLFTGQGKVAITSGSAVVTGTSTAFTADFVKDDNIRIAGVDYKVLSVASNTSLTLTTNSAVTLSAQTYQVGVTVDKSYAIYGNWVVSNADIESYSLLLKTAKAGLTTSIPLIKWCKFELNLHYDEQ